MCQSSWIETNSEIRESSVASSVSHLFLTIILLHVKVTIERIIMSLLFFFQFVSFVPIS